MIKVSNSKHLDIILPNTNKALAEVLKNTSPEQFHKLSQGKDLKSLISSILKQSISNPSVDKELLQLVKENPTLKNLGNINTSLKELSNVIKNSINSNQEELRGVLNSLAQNLKSSKSATHNQIRSQIQELLTQLPKESAPKNLEQLSQSVNKLLNNLNTTLKTADLINFPTIHKALESLKHLSDPKLLQLEKVLTNHLSDIKNLENTQLKQKLENSGIFLESKLKNLKSPIEELRGILNSLAQNLKSSKSATQNQIRSQIQELLTQLPKESVPKNLEQLSQSVNKLLNNVNTTLKGTDPITSPTIQKALESLKHLIDPKMLTQENFQFPQIKEQIHTISTLMQKSFTTESKGITALLEKIFSALKSIEQSSIKPSIEQLIAKNIPQDIEKLIKNLQNIFQKSDPIFKPESILLFDKLTQFNSALKLDPNISIKDILSSDLKAVLLQSSEEIKPLKIPNQNEILKHIEKLSLQIDHHQLLSHLSNNSSLYIPFTWDMLQDGKIEMKKSQDDKFFCDIYLQLKEYGELNIKMTLYDKNQLNLHIYSANAPFREIIKENITLLRSALIDTKIIPREIRIFEPKLEKKQHNSYTPSNDEFKLGFEVKV